MEAKLERLGEITIVHMAGQLTLEKNQYFRDVCLKQFKGDRKVVFSLDGLQFVGSSGIQLFFKTLSDLHGMNRFGVRLTGVQPDFLRLLQYSEAAKLGIHENVNGAMQSFTAPAESGNASSTQIPGSTNQENT